MAENQDSCLLGLCEDSVEFPENFFLPEGRKRRTFIRSSHPSLSSQTQHLGCAHVCATWFPMAAPQETESRHMSSCRGRLLLGYFCVNLLAAAMAGGKSGQEDRRQGMSVEL